MEETGCDQGEAELALELAGNDLEKAIRTIESLLRHIYAFKGKFYYREKNLYGLLMIVINTKTGVILRLHTVVSYNPSLFENSLSMDWYAFEKLIFSYRLDEGSLPDFTQENEEKLRSYLSSKTDVLAGGNILNVNEMLVSFFEPGVVSANIETEELNLAQFRQLPSAGSETNTRPIISHQETGYVMLQVELLEDKNGREVEKLSEGEVVLSKISDTRDIAHYLAHLIGGKREEDMIPLPASVRKVNSGADGYEVQVFLAPGVIGISKISSEHRIKIIEMKDDPWWKKIIPW